MDKYPEHEKLKALNGANQIVGEFIDWLSDGNIVLAEWGVGEYDGLVPINAGQTALIAGFFEIDEDKLEAEKCQMLDEIRKAQVD